MKKTLFISVCAVCLSFGVQADVLVPSIPPSTRGILYIDGHASDGSIPGSDCLEMMCPNGRCVESATGEGRCCPGNLPGKDESCDECGCKDGFICAENNTCVEKETFPAGVLPKCVFNGVELNTGASVGQCGKCQDGEIVVDESKVGVCQECKEDNWTLHAVEDGENLQGDGQCCVDGQMIYHDTICPKSEEIKAKMKCSSCSGDGCYAWTGQRHSHWEGRKCVLTLEFPEEGGVYKIVSGEASLTGNVQLGICTKDTFEFDLHQGTTINMTQDQPKISGYKKVQKNKPNCSGHDGQNLISKVSYGTKTKNILVGKRIVPASSKNKKEVKIEIIAGTSNAGKLETKGSTDKITVYKVK